ncbi:hypothetical protein E1301_Tti023461 [Triplophysa tibetana]|uniref:Ig-like domain-containing protein n=1 Tax=Triplophysa tibetana TaxID=1572043 RepID=A0A5A9NIN7_9TELE|nr:hypothetical protein E1301_Tti023461 [Triplophysa tibetana]
MTAFVVLSLQFQYGLNNHSSPIGSVKVSVNCSSGERRVFCSSDGDELIFSWTLNGLPQTEGNEIFVLDDKTSGNISCGVKNHVSRGEKSITLNYCTESTTVSVTSSLTNSTLVSTYGTSLSDSNLTSTQTPESSLLKSSQAGVELIYADINHMKPNREHQEKTAVNYQHTREVLLLLLTKYCNAHESVSCVMDEFRNEG